MLFLVQPRIPFALCAARAHYCLMFNFGSNMSSKSFSAKLLSRQLACSLYRCLGFLLFCQRTLPFPFLNLMIFLTPHFSSLLKSLWVAPHQSGSSAPPPNFVSPIKWLGVRSASSFRSLMKVFNSTGP